MDASELAFKLLEWEQVRRQLDSLEAEIRAAVLEIGKTQTVGRVRASYSGGTKTYDYMGAAQSDPRASQDLIDLYTTQTPKVNWRQLCSDLEIKDIPYAKSSPSVTIKLLP